MNHSVKNPDAHRRLARGANALSPTFTKISRRYMAGAEFKARQVWLDFQDAVGPALEAIADTIDRSRKAFKAWLKRLILPAALLAEASPQLPLALASPALP